MGKGGCVILVPKRSAGVAPQLSLRNALRAYKGNKWSDDPPRFEIYGRYHQVDKIGLSIAPQKRTNFVKGKLIYFPM